MSLSPTARAIPANLSDQHVVIPHRDRDDAVVVDQKFNRDPIGEVDRHGMKPFELALQGVQMQDGWKGLASSSRSNLR